MKRERETKETRQTEEPVTYVIKVVLGTILIVIGIIGIPLPIIPGVLLIVIGVILIGKRKAKSLILRIIRRIRKKFS